VLLDNAERLDKLVNGPPLMFPTAAVTCWIPGWGYQAEPDPLSKQYMTLAAAQADIANIRR
jgi:hypothetical protein